jgi:hypothetical protein
LSLNNQTLEPGDYPGSFYYIKKELFVKKYKCMLMLALGGVGLTSFSLYPYSRTISRECPKPDEEHPILPLDKAFCAVFLYGLIDSSLESPLTQEAKDCFCYFEKWADGLIATLTLPDKKDSVAPYKALKALDERLDEVEVRHPGFSGSKLKRAMKRCEETVERLASERASFSLVEMVADNARKLESCLLASILHEALQRRHCQQALEESLHRSRKRNLQGTRHRSPLLQ